MLPRWSRLSAAPEDSISARSAEASAWRGSRSDRARCLSPSYHVSRAYVNQVNVTNTVVNVTKVTNVYNTYTTTNINNTTVNRITYVNQTTAVTAVSRDTFVNARPVAHNVVAVEPREIAQAPIGHMSGVEPVRGSVMGAGKPTTIAPPRAVINRQVVAQHAPVQPPRPSPSGRISSSSVPSRQSANRPATSRSTPDRSRQLVKKYRSTGPSRRKPSARFSRRVLRSRTTITRHVRNPARSLLHSRVRGRVQSQAHNRVHSLVHNQDGRIRKPGPRLPYSRRARARPVTKKQNIRTGRQSLNPRPSRSQKDQLHRRKRRRNKTEKNPVDWAELSDGFEDPLRFCPVRFFCRPEV